MQVTIVGAGRMGLALADNLLESEGVDEVRVCGRHPEPPSHPIFTQGRARWVFGLERPERGTSAVLLAVPDDALLDVVPAVARLGEAPDGCAAFHLNGALSTDILAPLHESGYALGTFQPLQAVSHAIASADRIPGSAVAISGAPGALQIARALCRALGCFPVEVPPGRRAVVHAAAALSAGVVPATLAVASRLMSGMGLPEDEALAALIPLLRGVLSQIEAEGLAGVAAPPFSEDDTETVSLHLRALEGDERRLYAVLGREVARIAQEEAGRDASPRLLQIFDSELDP